MPKLVVLSEGLTGKTFELKEAKSTVGRVEDNLFHIPEPSVSSHHCEILLNGNNVVVKDLNSTNGTFINGEKVTEAPLKAGQILRLGQIEMRLETGAPGEAKKQPLDQTRVIQGVKLDDLEAGGKPVFAKDSPFTKKSNKTAMIFMTIGIILGIVILVSLFFALQRIK